MKLKKIMIAGALLSGVVMVGCGNNDTEQVLVKEDLNMTTVESGLKDSGVLKEGSFESVAKDHYIFDSVKDVIEEGFISQAMINIRLQDVFFVKTTDADAVEKAILDYKETSLRSFADGYGGEENITAVSNSKLVKMGNYVYFIATENADEVEAKLLELIK